MNPQISVLLPVYNSNRFLPEAIASLQRQSFGDFECLICDGSPEGTDPWLTRLVGEDRRFRLLYEKNASLPESLRMGMERARAPLLARMDADDVCLPERFAVQLAAMKERPQTVLLGCSYRYIDATGKPGRVKIMPQRPELADLLWGCPFLHPGVLLRRDAVLAAGGYRKEFKRAEDYDLWFRLLKEGRLENLADVLMHYRVHGGNASLDQAAATRRQAIRAQALYFLQQDAPADMGSDALLEKLYPAQAADIIMRMLACHAQSLGDMDEDAEGRDWLARYAPLATRQIRDKALALWHLHCALRYLPGQKRRALGHMARAFLRDWRASFAAMAAWTRSLLPS